jgi:hypothetical protein
MFKIIFGVILVSVVMCSKSPVSVNSIDQGKQAKVYIPRSTNINVTYITLKCEGNIEYQFSSQFLPDTFTLSEGKRIDAHWQTQAGEVHVDTVAINGMTWQLGY